MTDWRLVQLGDIADEVTVGHVGSMVHEYQSHGVPLLRSQNVLRHGFDLRDVKFISSDFHGRLKKSALRPGDVVTVRTGKPGATAVVPPDWEHANCSDLVITRPGKEIDPYWLSYYINSAASGYIDSQLVGAVQQHFNVGSAKSMVLNLPSMAEQRAIAEVLGALDDKITANTKLAETTDQLARLVYTSILADATEIPLSKTAEFVNGKAFTKGASGTGRVVVRIAELNSGIGGSTVYSDAEVDDKHTARAGDLLFAWSGSLTLHRWYREDAIINQHIFKVIPLDDYPLWLVDQLLQSKIGHFKAVAADKATTMGHIQRRHLDEPVLVPSPEAIRANSVLMEGLWNLGLLAEQENEKLAASRDALLPQLMSGQLRVSDL